MSTGFFLYGQEDKYLVRNTFIYVKKLLMLYVCWSTIFFPLQAIDIVRSGSVVKHSVLFLRDLFYLGSYAHLWYLPAIVFGVLVVSYLLYKGIPLKFILILSVCFYVVGVFDDSWYGVLPKGLKTPVCYYNYYFVTTRNGLFEGLL